MASSLACNGLWAASPVLNHFGGGRIFDARTGDLVVAGFQVNWMIARRLVRNLDAAQVFVIVHNIESECRAHRTSTHLVNRLFPVVERWNIESLRRLDWELGGCHVGCVSYNDLQTLRAMAIPCKSLEFVGWTTLVDDEDILVTHRGLGPDSTTVKKTLLFAANGGNPDNGASLDWFLRVVAPSLPRPGAWRLLLVGPGWKEYPLNSPIVIQRLGFVERLSAVLARGMVGINPDVSGVGVKTKMLDYAAMGLPAVSTRLGTQGLPPEAQRFLQICDDPADWSTALEKLQDPRHWTECSRLMIEMSSQYATREAFAGRLCAWLSRTADSGNKHSERCLAPRDRQLTE